MVNGKTLEEQIIEEDTEKLLPMAKKDKLPMAKKDKLSMAKKDKLPMAKEMIPIYLFKNTHCDNDSICNFSSTSKPDMIVTDKSGSAKMIYPGDDLTVKNKKSTDSEYSDGFYALTKKMDKIHRAKNADYAGDNPYSNFMQCKALGIDAFTGVLVRIGDKYSRIVNLAKKGCEGEVKDESIMDTLIDLANYSLIAILVKQYEENLAKKSKK